MGVSSCSKGDRQWLGPWKSSRTTGTIQRLACYSALRLCTPYSVFLCLLLSWYESGRSVCPKVLSLSNTPTSSPLHDSVTPAGNNDSLESPTQQGFSLSAIRTAHQTCERNDAVTVANCGDGSRLQPGQ